MRGLYPIVDLDALEAKRIPVLEFAERVLSVRPSLIQLRAKHASPRETLAWLRALRPLCSAAGAALFANDRPDLAVMGGCDGVHVGQTDLSVPDVRRVAPALRVGLSTHDRTQLAHALELGPDYVAYGPVFPTGSKEQPDQVVGLEGLAWAARAAAQAGLPLVAIGGIDLERAPSIAELGATGAVIGALLPADGALRGDAALAEVEANAHALHAALSG